jgi:hypothetical protein
MHLEFEMLCNVFGLKSWWVSNTYPIVKSMIKRVSTGKLYCGLGVTPHTIKVIRSARFQVRVFKLSSVPAS